MKGLAKMTGKALKDTLAKTEMVVFRVSKSDKTDMQAMAKRLGLSLTEYLGRLHSIAKQKLK
jgi:hypothetical protein